MTHFKESIGLALLCAAIPAVGRGQDPAVSLENYTSDVAVTTINGLSVSQQVGSPLAPPVREDGDLHLYQGLFNAVTGTEASVSTGVNPTFVNDDNDIRLHFDATLKHLSVSSVSNEATLAEASLIVTDMAGNVVERSALNTRVAVIDLSALAAGTYMAGVFQNNNFSKTLKFIVR